MLCPAYRRERNKLRSAFPTRTKHIAKLLAPGVRTNHLMAFISNTGRFKAERLGPQNSQTPGTRNDDEPRRESREDRLRAGHNFWIQMGWAIPPRRSQSPLPTNGWRGDG
jgi:hypothetical protein